MVYNGVMSTKNRSLSVELVTPGIADALPVYWRQLKPANAPDLEAEFRFDPTRRWRADFRVGNVLVEVEGGVWVGGRHVNPSGFMKDCEKYNRAAEMGYAVLRYPTQVIQSDPQAVVDQIAAAWKAHP